MTGDFVLCLCRCYFFCLVLFSSVRFVVIFGCSVSLGDICSLCFFFRCVFSRFGFFLCCLSLYLSFCCFVNMFIGDFFFGFGFFFSRRRRFFGSVGVFD